MNNNKFLQSVSTAQQHNPQACLLRSKLHFQFLNKGLWIITLFPHPYSFTEMKARISTVGCTHQIAGYREKRIMSIRPLNHWWKSNCKWEIKIRKSKISITALDTIYLQYVLQFALNDLEFSRLYLNACNLSKLIWNIRLIISENVMSHNTIINKDLWLVQVVLN